MVNKVVQAALIERHYLSGVIYAIATMTIKNGTHFEEEMLYDLACAIKNIKIANVEQ